MSGSAALKEGQIVTGPMFNEPMQVETVRASGPDIRMVGLLGGRSR